MDEKPEKFEHRITTANGGKAKFKAWKDKNGVHILYEYTDAEAFEALDDSLSTKELSQEKYDELLKTIGDIMGL